MFLGFLFFFTYFEGIIGQLCQKIIKKHLYILKNYIIKLLMTL